MIRTTTASRGRPRAAEGFSLIEALIAIAVLLVILAAVFGLITDTARKYKSESSQREMRQAARAAVDELGRSIRHAGYGIRRSDPYNSAKWQRDIVYAGAHAIAFNADLDLTLGPIDDTRVLTFPTAETYAGEGAASTTTGAETYVYSLDADGDDQITLSDRSLHESGSYNPASFTANPKDFALFLRIHGYDGSAYTVQVVPVTPYLFTNAVNTVDYADGTTPAPLFTYWMTEDLNADGLLDDAECVDDVIDSCPPSPSRAPVNYLWGDTDFDGRLSDSERDQLIQSPVGSVNWSKNPLLVAGAYKSTTLSSSIDPTAADPHIVEVASATDLAPGSQVRIGTGANAEVFVVDSVSTGTVPHVVTLTSDPVQVHAAGSTMQVLPTTLLRAIAAVRVHFTAVTPRRDHHDENAPSGQAGRAATHAMDYRTMILQRTIELVNLRAAALR